MYRGKVDGHGRRIPEFTIVSLPNWESVNGAVLREFSLCRETPDRHSHLFHGRFENLYIDKARMPSMQVLLDRAAGQAAGILGITPSRLKYGYWFNLMHPGHVTSLHSHDEDDELLSCVYYLDVPTNSGDLVLELAEGSKYITPESGMFVFFPPYLEHAVTENRSKLPRLSLAINFGSADRD
jgi:hypothetical protein